jgi:hypothetical protein
MPIIKSKKRNKNIFEFFIIFFIIFSCLILFIFREITSSVFLKGRDKVNIIFYGEKTRFFSIDRKNINYELTFSNLIKVVVPGGYNIYKVGAIGKLVSLEKDPNLFKKTFSATTSSLVDLYFYQKKAAIYFEDINSEHNPNIKEIFFFTSNANIIDRFIIFSIFSSNDKDNFQIIDLEPFYLEKNGNIFDNNLFYKKYQGSFFQKIYRSENINIQIIYQKSYKTAQLISQMIEGEGIRVVDLSNQKYKSNKCMLISNKSIISSKTFKLLQDYFKCNVRVGETTVSDIIFQLGELEKEWAVN